MKKTALVLVLLLVMAGSVTAGTLSMYTTSIDSLAQGSVVAKEFVFTGEGTDSFAHGVKIAPQELVTWQFSVKNYAGPIITETDLYYKLTFDVRATAGKTAIEPLTVSIKDENGNILGSARGVGIFDVLGIFPLAEAGQSKTYTVEVFWPSDDSIDINYAGEAYGTTVNIDAVASQVPLSGEGPSEPQPRNISVLYQTTKSWQNGQSGDHLFAYSVTITNNSDQPIENWFIDLMLSQDRLTSAWSNAKMVKDLPDGQYRFVSPNYNNQNTDSIQPGQSVTFGGQGVGFGTSAPQGVKVGGNNASSVDTSLSCQFGSLS